MTRLFRSRLLWIAVAVMAVAACCRSGVSGYVLGLLTAAYYFGVFAMAWDLLFGFAGEVNFGPTFLIGLGAYTAAILDNQCGPPIPVCLVAGAVVALVGGLLLALPALRLRGPYFGLVTLVAVLLLQNVIVMFAGITGGEIGMTMPDVLSIDDGANYWYALGLHGGQRRHAVRPVALGRRPHPAGERPGRDRGRRRSASTSPSTSSRRSASARSSPASPARMLIFYMGTASVGTVVDIAHRRAGHHRRRAAAAAAPSSAPRSARSS